VYRNHYLFVHDTASPTTLDNHDRLLIANTEAKEWRKERVGDHLVLCLDRASSEIVIDSHYCKASQLSLVDTPNQEIEQIVFMKSGDIWLADALFDEWRASGLTFPPAQNDLYQRADGQPWRVQRFSEVLPDTAKATATCE
jgi:hypothetical protein